MADAYVYILGNKGGMLYVGVTSNLERRILEHKTKVVPGYTSKFSIDRLLYFDTFHHMADALAAEKQIKGWVRKKKLALIEEANPSFKDLSEGWFES
jgi:putative endonuclease